MKRLHTILIILIIVVNIIFDYRYIERWLHFQSQIKDDVNQSRMSQALKYTGFENVVNFAIIDSNITGNIGILPLEPIYTERYTEFYVLSAISNHEVYFAPCHMLLDYQFIRSRNIKRMVILHNDSVNVINYDSLWSDDAELLYSSIEDRTIELRWKYEPYKHMRIYLFDVNGFYITDMPVPANPYGDSIYFIKRELITPKNPHYWTVSKMSFVNFSKKTGRLND